ncbi:MAG: hypothetical protein EBR85_06885 [Betaproteobacteria bacterium]|nr:hypothetical protein [Betaproteobacteria bacterium]
MVRGEASLQLPKSSVQRILATAKLMKPGSSDVYFGLLDGQPALIAEPWCLFESSQQSVSAEPKLAVVIGVSGNYWIAAAADTVEWQETSAAESARLRPLPALEAGL